MGSPQFPQPLHSFWSSRCCLPNLEGCGKQMLNVACKGLQPSSSQLSCSKFAFAVQHQTEREAAAVFCSVGPWPSHPLLP